MGYGHVSYSNHQEHLQEIILHAKQSRSSFLLLLHTVSDSTFLRIPSTKLQTVEKVVSCVYGNNKLSAYKVLSDELKVSMAPRDPNTTYPVAAWHSHLIRLLSVGYFCLFYTTVTFSLNDCSTMM